MVVSSKPSSSTEQYSYVRSSNRATAFSPPVAIPIVDLAAPDAKTLIVKACEELGFFKVINHGVPIEAISQFESEATKFFSLPLSEKEKPGFAKPFGYGNKHIGCNGDVGWIEYLLLQTNKEHYNNNITHSSVSDQNPEQFRGVLKNYMQAVKKMACEILELMGEGLKIEPKNALSKLVMDEKSDSCFRVNHYPACPDHMKMATNGGDDQNMMIGFGEHTDPQIISLLRSNNTSGLQIYVGDGNWISVPPDHSSFFINVGDALQVMTNGRFRSVRHRVLANGFKSRLSMIYFVGPPLSEKIAPLPSLMFGKESLYKEFTWFEYKKSTYSLRLAADRLGHFKRIAAS